MIVMVLARSAVRGACALFVAFALLSTPVLLSCASFKNAPDESSVVDPANPSQLQVFEDVDIAPVIIQEVYPEYSRLAQDAGLQGTVWVQMVVDTAGHPQDVQLKTSCGTRSLDESAVAAAWKYSFIPAIKSGVPVPAKVAFPIEFKLKR